ncbi:hypothetical protein PDIG_65610 [Penicillium digitatum PHI26]|uniref:Uncharacterized protein n=2 Tax=Penicillium digitatum TaxID=36651 RepID=K9FKB6_PEND2|nr:hypothetical protein PDIP_74930 [Penicillium digitatum Pd1]EKV07251.1 hypothetical protein PDIP_74930 [Penicillium digitatum Pd1]EKV08697.1 hypothetical protein PDIG_65610 [Penicillium digitatum PHI26]KAG0159411.1 hypothetical protein PDIDSM_6933 [Penicillium digitatum]
MVHGHHGHSRIGKLISIRRHRKAGLDEQDAGSDLPDQTPILPDTDKVPDENCDSKNSLCLERGMNESDLLLEKRDETTSADPTIIETVLQVVDASSQIPFQSTATKFPTTISGSAYATDLPSGSDGLTATATASISIDLGLLTSPTASSISDTSISSSADSTQTSSTASTNLTSRLPSASRSASATVINSPVRTPTRLIAPSSPKPSATTTLSQAHNYWLYPDHSSSSASASSSNSNSGSSTSSASSTDYTTSSSNVNGGSESTSSATGTGSTPTASQTLVLGQNSTSNPDTPKIVGGVVGSVAGLTLIALLLFYYLRRRGFFMEKTGRPNMIGDAAAGAGAGSREIVERRESNDPLFTASYLAPAFMKRWRQSTATTRSGSTIDSAPSERGFQKISGRKLPPVFTHGGDGYGGGFDGDSPIGSGFSATSPAMGPMASPSFYAPPPTSPYGSPLDSNFTREVEEPTPPTRPNLTHLPNSNTVTVATPITVTPAHPVAQPQSAMPFVPPRPDGLGRSLHSFDGSRSSRFTEVMDQ